MSRSKEYQRLLNSKRWKVLRANYLSEHPLCERCLQDGYYTPAVDVHHIKPVESAHTPEEMERLAYNVNGNNLQALCISCHKAVHRELMSQTREGHKANAKRDLERWVTSRKGRKPTE